MILFLILLINMVIGHKDFKYKYLSFSAIIDPFFSIVQRNISKYIKKYPFYILFCIVIITIFFGYNFYKSIDPLMEKEASFLTYSSWFSTPIWFLMYFCIFIDISFYYRQKKVVSALISGDIENAKTMMREITEAPLENIDDIYNELIIWMTSNSLYRFFLPLFYYMLGDIPFLLGYYLLYPFFKQVTKIHDAVVYFPIALLAIIGTMLSILTGNVASIIDESWSAMRYCSTNKKLLKGSNANYLAVGFMIATGCNLKYYSIDDCKYIETPAVKQVTPELVKIDGWAVVMLLKERNIILPIFALCLGFFISYVFLFK